MEGILSIFWLIGCSTVLPIIIIWLVTRKQINETNKRTEIIMSALEKNPDVNVAEWLDKLAPENKSKLLKEKLMIKLTWGIICLILGIGTIIYRACFSLVSPMPTFIGGGALFWSASSSARSSSPKKLRPRARRTSNNDGQRSVHSTSKNPAECPQKLPAGLVGWQSR